MKSASKRWRSEFAGTNELRSNIQPLSHGKALSCGKIAILQLQAVVLNEGLRWKIAVVARGIGLRAVDKVRVRGPARNRRGVQ